MHVSSTRTTARAWRSMTCLRRCARQDSPRRDPTAARPLYACVSDPSWSRGRKYRAAALQDDGGPRPGTIAESYGIPSKSAFSIARASP
jgi:hypothetical protein